TCACCGRWGWSSYAPPAVTVSTRSMRAALKPFTNGRAASSNSGMRALSAWTITCRNYHKRGSNPMAMTDRNDDTQDREILVRRRIAGPRDLVYEAFTNAD